MAHGQPVNSPSEEGPSAPLGAPGWPDAAAGAWAAHSLAVGTSGSGPLSETRASAGAGEELSRGGSSASASERSGAAKDERQQCAFFLRTGTCAYGDRCKFSHPKDRPPPVLNSRGYPLRDASPDCSFYLRKGWCAFGVTCKFNHPELSDAAIAAAAASVLGGGMPAAALAGAATAGGGAAAAAAAAASLLPYATSQQSAFGLAPLATPPGMVMQYAYYPATAVQPAPLYHPAALPAMAAQPLLQVQRPVAPARAQVGGMALAAAPLAATTIDQLSRQLEGMQVVGGTGAGIGMPSNRPGGATSSGFGLGYPQAAPAQGVAYTVYPGATHGAGGTGSAYYPGGGAGASHRRS